jgi:endonuclease YncB( thermonuclease family)
VRLTFLLACAFFVEGSLTYAYGDGDAPAAAPAAANAGIFTCTPIWVHDGDTFTCSDRTRIRVAGINAREIGWDGAKNYDNGCNSSAPCPRLDAVAARDRLVSLIGKPQGLDANGNMRVTGPNLTCEPNGATYNRVAAFCTSPIGGDISCRMVASGAAARWDKFWLRRRC